VFLRRAISFTLCVVASTTIFFNQSVGCIAGAEKVAGTDGHDAVVRPKPHQNPRDRGGEDFNHREYLGLVLDNALTKQLKNPNSYIIVIARMGTTEVKTDLNQSRLKYVKGYLKSKNPQSKFICAEAERINEKGGLEIYVDGEMFGKVGIGKNEKRYCLGVPG
jgi:hypothetical protein